jgi:hypothetical protein
MRQELLVLSESVSHITETSKALEPYDISCMAVRTSDVAARARHGAGHAGFLVLYLTERDNLADVRAVLASSGVRVLLFAPTSPPHAALARVAEEYGAMLCSARDPLPVRQAALVAFVSNVRSTAGS